MATFKTVLNLVTQQGKLGCGLIALVTAGGERLFSTTVFQCPCSNLSFAYASVFLMVPALVLMVLGYLLNQKTWRLMTGMCLQKAKLCVRRKFLARWRVFMQISGTALVAPCSWVAVALLHGDYFECAVTGFNLTFLQNHLCVATRSQESCRQHLYQLPCRARVSIQGLTPTDMDNVLANARAASQIIGWVLVASILMCNLAMTCFTRCYSPVSFQQLKFWQMYKQQESSLLESHCADHAKQLANRNLKSFFDKTPPEDMVIPSSNDWQEISSFYKYHPNCYSTMHHYVDHTHEPQQPDNWRSASVRSCGPSRETPAVLSFLDHV